MAKARDPIEEIIEVMANMQAANNTALIALAKTLEDAGTMKVKDYKKALRHAAEDLAHNGALGPSALLEDLAEMMKHDEVKKQ